jgi:hypothetical protein
MEEKKSHIRKLTCLKLTSSASSGLRSTNEEIVSALRSSHTNKVKAVSPINQGEKVIPNASRYLGSPGDLKSAKVENKIIHSLISF